MLITTRSSCFTTCTRVQGNNCQPDEMIIQIALYLLLDLLLSRLSNSHTVATDNPSRPQMYVEIRKTKSVFLQTMSSSDLKPRTHSTYTVKWNQFGFSHFQGQPTQLHFLPAVESLLQQTQQVNIPQCNLSYKVYQFKFRISTRAVLIPFVGPIISDDTEDDDAIFDMLEKTFRFFQILMLSANSNYKHS